jgi:hypothetical protein
MAVEKRSTVDCCPPAALHLATEPLITVLREAESFDPSFAQECMSAVARCMGLHNSSSSSSNSTTAQQQQRSGAVQTRSWQEAQAAAASATTTTRTTAAAGATATAAGAVQLTAGVLRCVNSFLQAGVVEALLPLLQPQFELARLQVVELLELLLGAVRGDVESRILQFPTGMQVRCYYTASYAHFCQHTRNSDESQHRISLRAHGESSRIWVYNDARCVRTLALLHQCLLQLTRQQRNVIRSLWQ